MKMKDAVRQFMLDKELENLSDATIVTYKSALKKLVAYAGEMDVAQMDATFARSYMRYLKDMRNPQCRNTEGRYSSKSLQDFFIILQAFDNWLVEQDYLIESATEKIPSPRVEEELPEIVTEEQLKRLFRILDAECDFRVQILFEVFLDTGIRSNELIGINVDDVNIDDGWFKVYGKGRREAIVPFGQHLASKLHRYINEVRPMIANVEEKALFVSQWGNRYSRQALYAMIARYLKRTGVEGKLGPHKLRHTFATNYLKNGGDLESLRRIMRHKSVLTTQKYIGLVNEDLKIAHNKASPLDRLRESL